MSIAPGKPLLHYRLVEKVGEGGMGVVWKAVDTKLDREVAVKVLPEVFARDAERLARFEREAKLLAALNHPNIAAIYGVEHVDDARFLVLELVGGESLDETLARGALPLDEALKAGEQIAAGMQAAHDQGILHRDLKPANIRRTPEGRIKLLDFGLAKALMPATSAGDPMLSPTITTDGTIAGSILGTASYMSPEQARGKPLDRRTDVWSFGCVLYEALAGKRAFPGETISDVIARVLQVEPDWSLLPATLPASIRRLLGRCLQKDQDRRLRDIGDARFELQEALAGAGGALAGAGGTLAGVTSGGWSAGHAGAPGAASGAAIGAPAGALGRFAARRWAAPALGVALLAAAAAGAWGARLFTAPPTAAPAAAALRFEMVLPEEAPLAVGSFINPLTLSPDGRVLVYVGVQKGTRRLFVRDLNRFEVMTLAGTEGAEGPFFSPDGQWVAFHADGKLKKISVRGGLPQRIIDTVDFRGATWLPDDTIVLAPGQDATLARVPASGGEMHAVTTFDAAKGEFSHRFPQFLPGGRTVIFAAQENGFNPEDAAIYALTLATGERKLLMRASSDVRYAPTGHLIFSQAGSLMAVPFDAGRLLVTGPPRPVGEGVVVQKNTGAAQFVIGQNGTMIYVTGDAIGGSSDIFWREKTGAITPYPADKVLYRWPRLSPDGKRLAVLIIGAAVQGIWVAETGSHDFMKVAEGTGNVWSPDGGRIYFVIDKDGTLCRKRSDGSGSSEILLKGEHSVSPTSISPDGKTLLFTRRDPKTNLDIMALALEDGGQTQPPARQARPLAQTPAQEGGARFSPDGRHIAYVSDETGRFEIFLMDFPGAGGKWQVSRGGGKDPVWSTDGRLLYFRQGDNIMSVTITTQPTFQSGRPELIVEGAYEGLLGTLDRPNYDVAPDGRILLVKNPGVEGKSSQVRLIQNFFQDLIEPR